jgi:hypothetical protein
MWSVLGSSQGPMDGLGGDDVVTPTVTSRNNRRAMFPMRGRCRSFVTDTANLFLDYLTVVKLTTVQVTKLPL